MVVSKDFWNGSLLLTVSINMIAVPTPIVKPTAGVKYSLYSWAALQSSADDIEQYLLVVDLIYPLIEQDVCLINLGNNIPKGDKIG